MEIYVKTPYTSNIQVQLFVFTAVTRDSLYMGKYVMVYMTLCGKYKVCTHFLLPLNYAKYVLTVSFNEQKDECKTKSAKWQIFALMCLKKEWKEPPLDHTISKQALEIQVCDLLIQNVNGWLDYTVLKTPLKWWPGSNQHLYGLIKLIGAVGLRHTNTVAAVSREMCMSTRGTIHAHISYSQTNT